MAAAVAAAVVSAACVATPALAQPGALRDLFGKSGAAARRPQYPSVGRYVAAQGETFVLDRSNGSTLLKFDDSGEVWALRATPGPRGDLIYRNDVGQPMVRATRLGGLTLFTPDRPTGTPAAFATESPPLRPRTLSPSALFQLFLQASNRASRAAGRSIGFEATDVPPGSEALFADAANLASDGIIAAAALPGGKSRLARLRRVRFSEGGAPLTVVSGSTLEVVVSPKQGPWGRPSSRRAAQAVLVSR